MATPTSPGMLWRWLRGAWLGWIALGLLVLAMSLVLEPRLEQFMAYWYSVPSEAISHEQAVSLREQRQQAVWRQAWIIGAAPVAAIFLLDLLFVLFARQNDVTGDDDNTVDYQPASGTPDEAEKTVVRPAVAALTIPDTPTDTTQIRPAISVVSAEDARYIGQGGRYRVENLLGAGGMGSVYRGFDTVLQRPVALKSLHLELARGDQEQVGRFRREAHALAGLSHQHIVPVYDLFEEGDEFWMVLEYLPGGDLDALLQKKPPTIKQSIAIIKAIARGLDYAHNKSFIHRDVKPMNILFSEDGMPKMVDFGIAKGGHSEQAVARTQSGLSLGSPTYMSPEQACGESNIDRRADIYSLGITFFKMLTNDVPFKSDDPGAVMVKHVTQPPPSPRTLNPVITEELDAIVMKMLAKKPDERYQNLEEFITALDALTKN